MRALSGADFLQLWENGSSLHPVDQGLLALLAGHPETSYEALADWPLGRRNQALAELRCSCFGSRIEGWVACPRCAEKLEFEIDARELAAAGERREVVVVNGKSYRLPTSRDLARVAREPDEDSAAARLLESCRLEGGAPAATEAEIEAIGEQLALADPLAETTLSLSCSSCGHDWEEAIDITAFLWTEVEARAKRLLLEVHTLAAAYGWSEREILALSEPRRAFYLEMVRA